MIERYIKGDSMKKCLIAVAIIAITAVTFTACSKGASKTQTSEGPQALTAAAAQSQSSPEDETELRIGSSVSGIAGRDQKITYNLRSTEEGLLIIQIESEIQIWLEVYDDQQFITSSIDDYGNFYPRIAFITHPDTAYLLEVRSYVRSADGAFRITAAHQAVTPLISGSYSGFIESRQEYWFSAHISRNGILDIHTTGDTDTILEAYNENFELLADDDDSGEDYNAQIKMDVRSGQILYFRLTALAYTVGGDSGPYEINASVSDYPTPIRLAPGRTHDAYIENGGEHWYSAAITEGDHLTVETMGSTDTILTAYNMNRYAIDENDDYEDLNARIRITISDGSQFGTYIFKLRSHNSGNYRILASIDFAL